jgi:hypothetical protein
MQVKRLRWIRDAFARVAVSLYRKAALLFRLQCKIEISEHLGCADVHQASSYEHANLV